MSVVKIFVLTRGVHAPRPGGQPDGCPIPLSCGIALELESRQRRETFFKGLIKFKVNGFSNKTFGQFWKLRIETTILAFHYSLAIAG